MTISASLRRNLPGLYRVAREFRYRMSGWPEAEIALLPMLADPARIAVDVGAHVGVYSCALRGHARSVVAFEPNPSSARLLARICPWARIIEAAASDRAGTAELRIPRDQRGRATIARENALAQFETETVTVRTVTLDEVIEAPVGFMKIDVEGHERDVLAGARGILERDRPTLLVEIEERHRPGSTAAVPAFLQSLGYAGFLLDAGRLRSARGFDPARDQLGPEDPERKNARHLNNFVFVHGIR